MTQDKVLAKLAELFGDSFTSDNFSKVEKFLGQYMNPLDILADFSEEYTCFDESLPAAFEKVLYPSHVQRHVRRGMVELLGAYLLKGDQKDTHSLARSLVITPYHLYEVLCDFIILNNRSGRKNIREVASGFRRQLRPSSAFNTAYVVKDVGKTEIAHGDLVGLVNRCPEITGIEIISSTTKEKENSMVDVATVAILKQLAKTSDSKDDLTSLVGEISPDVDKALAELQAEENSSKAKREAKVIFDLQKRCESLIASKVETVRSLRRQESKVMKELAAITKAKQYAAETKNFLPLVLELDGCVPGMAIHEVEIAKDWKPKE